MTYKSHGSGIKLIVTFLKDVLVIKRLGNGSAELRKRRIHYVQT